MNEEPSVKKKVDLELEITPNNIGINRGRREQRHSTGASTVY